MHLLYNLGESLDRVKPGGLVPDDRILAGSTSATQPPPRLRAGGFVPDTPPPACLSHVSDGERKPPLDCDVERLLAAVVEIERAALVAEKENAPDSA